MGIKDLHRGKTMIYFVFPYLLAMGLYYHFGEELTGQTVSWQDVMTHDELIEVDALAFKQFDGLRVEQHANISVDVLDSLLNGMGIDSTGMEEANEAKIHVLLKVPSPDFW